MDVGSSKKVPQLSSPLAGPEHIAINNHQPNSHNTTRIFEIKEQTAIWHSPDDWLVHHMDEEMEDNLWRKATCHGELGSALRLNIIDNVMKCILL